MKVRTTDIANTLCYISNFNLAAREVQGAHCFKQFLEREIWFQYILAFRIKAEVCRQTFILWVAQLLRFFSSQVPACGEQGQTLNELVECMKIRNYPLIELQIMYEYEKINIQKRREAKYPIPDRTKSCRMRLVGKDVLRGEFLGEREGSGVFCCFSHPISVRASLSPALPLPLLLHSSILHLISLSLYQLVIDWLCL